MFVCKLKILFMKLSITAQKAIEAYGGLEFWKNVKSIEANVSVTGLAFILKQVPPFNNINIKLETEKPYSKITPINKKTNFTGIFTTDKVFLVDNDDSIIIERLNPRSFFPYGRRLFYWDDLDITYFANYAFWNYFTFPKLLLNEDIIWVEKFKGCLIAKFPKTFPTHSYIQEFYFDIETGLLVQHNYTADIISSFAKVANVVTKHDSFNNIIFPSQRIVTPRNLNSKPLKKPVLIKIDIHSIQFS